MYSCVHNKSFYKYSKHRSSHFWEYDCHVPEYEKEIFKNNFRMSHDTFNKLCQYLKNMKRSTTFRNGIAFEKRIEISFYALGSSSEYRSLVLLFGVSKIMVCKLLIEFCHEVYRHLKPIYLNKFPLSNETIAQCVDDFEILGLPQCLASIDGYHIEIHKTSEDAVDYYNYKGWYSTVLLALVDYRHI